MQILQAVSNYAWCGEIKYAWHGESFSLFHNTVVESSGQPETDTTNEEKYFFTQHMVKLWDSLPQDGFQAQWHYKDFR